MKQDHGTLVQHASIERQSAIVYRASVVLKDLPETFRFHVLAKLWYVGQAFEFRPQ